MAGGVLYKGSVCAVNITTAVLCMPLTCFMFMFVCVGTL